MTQMFNYKGFKIVVRGTAEKPLVQVFNPGKQSREGALHETTSLDLAMRWADTAPQAVGA